MYTDLNMGAYLVYNTSTCMISSALCLKEKEKKKLGRRRDLESRKERPSEEQKEQKAVEAALQPTASPVRLSLGGSPGSHSASMRRPEPVGNAEPGKPSTPHGVLRTYHLTQLALLESNLHFY